MSTPFNKPLITGQEKTYIEDIIKLSSRLSGDGVYTQKCNAALSQLTNSPKVLLTTSCTHALEMAALLLDIKPGDEVIMPSFTFVSTANPFVLRGARIVFVDIRPDTMNIDENLIEEAITKKTKAIVPVHYSAVGCEMDKIMSIAHEYGIYVVEDAAQCINSYYKGAHLGTIGHMGALSFHDTKNIHCGEGGCLMINDETLHEKAEVIREKGTNRAKFLRGEIDKYTWVSHGSSYLPSELNAAFLFAQLQNVEPVTKERLRIWSLYESTFGEFASNGRIEIQRIPEHTEHNGHIFYIKLKDIEERQQMIDRFKFAKISALFHYIPLHSSYAGKMFGRFHGDDNFTTKESEKLLRLPMYYGLSDEEIIGQKELIA